MDSLKWYSMKERRPSCEDIDKNNGSTYFIGMTTGGIEFWTFELRPTHWRCVENKMSCTQDEDSSLSNNCWNHSQECGTHTFKFDDIEYWAYLPIPSLALNEWEEKDRKYKERRNNQKDHLNDQNNHFNDKRNS